MNIQEKNRLIALYMGAEEIGIKNTFRFPTNPNPESSGTPIRTLEKLKYHKSWSWLMPVIEKLVTDIHRDGYEPSHLEIKHYLKLSIKLRDLFSYSNGSGIESVYESCLDFIQILNKKWENERSEVN